MIEEIKSNAELKSKLGAYLKENYGEWIEDAQKKYTKAVFDQLCECANNFCDAEGLDKTGVNDEVAKIMEDIYNVKNEAIKKYLEL